jgi:hypothetical protein
LVSLSGKSVSGSTAEVCLITSQNWHKKTEKQTKNQVHTTLLIIVNPLPRTYQ